MKKIIRLLFLSLLTLSVSCSKKVKIQENLELDSTPIINESEKIINMKIKQVDTKKELRNDGDYNQMTLFEVDNTITLEELKNYCSTVKPNYSSGYFQILVFFKKSNSARFPNNPLTGMFMEDEDMKNIKAIYTINNINGYSKLDYYSKNSFESLATSIDIY